MGESFVIFFFSSRRRHTRCLSDWSSDVCSSDLDIEDRKRAESQSRALIDAIPQQIWSGPPDGTIDYCSDRWRSDTGLGRSEERRVGKECRCQWSTALGEKK